MFDCTWVTMENSFGWVNSHADLGMEHLFWYLSVSADEKVPFIVQNVLFAAHCHGGLRPANVMMRMGYPMDTTVSPSKIVIMNWYFPISPVCFRISSISVMAFSSLPAFASISVRTIVGSAIYKIRRISVSSDYSKVDLMVFLGVVKRIVDL